MPPESLITVGLQAAGSPVLPLYYAEKIYDASAVLENVADTEGVHTKASTKTREQLSGPIHLDEFWNFSIFERSLI
ncbi:hypothetical protein JCM33374_g2227 [Metschnikowia sp. JCM 33374]|nr:hypothetical protein JCM33374_g2227 [Metschnikowia sp. JCM 33374]